MEVRLDQLIENPDNPRSSLGDLTELAANITVTGILTPLLVVENEDGRYLVVDGHRRLAAARTISGYTTSIPVRVVVMDRTERLLAALTSGLHSRSLNPLDEAVAVKALIEQHNISQAAIAQQLGFSQARIAKRLRLLDLPSSVQDDLAAGRITFSAAYKQIAQPRQPRVVPPPPRAPWPPIKPKSTTRPVADKDAVDLTGDHRLAYLDLVFEGVSGRRVTWRDATKDDHKEAVRVLAARLTSLPALIQKHNSSIAQLSRNQARTLTDIYGPAVPS